MTGNSASAQRDAAGLRRSLESICTPEGPQPWSDSCTNIGDAHSTVADLRVDRDALDRAAEACLDPLTAFEVSSRVNDDRRLDDVSTKVEADLQGLANLGLNVELVQIAHVDQADFQVYYLPCRAPGLRAPVIICISNEQETATALLGRIWPFVTTLGLSVLVVSYDDLSNHARGQSEVSLSCCLDYLSGRADVHPARIGVFGEGLSATLATDFAVFDCRIAAAVCDGGLWNWARTLAAVRWMSSSTADLVDQGVESVRRSRLVRQLRCPGLVVVGGYGPVSASEAIKLQADCRAACIDLEFFFEAEPRSTLKGTENFVSSDDRVFAWLHRKLTNGSDSKLIAGG
ncbi:hypothetical protein GGE24_007613 [Bradyrhizobium centrosematis]|nr:hypothetical protein [Bradyrhizobium centrosematis]